MLGWVQSQWRKLVGGSAPTEEPAVSAAELMQQMKAERARPADRAEWSEGMATLRTRVFSGMDRARLWRRARRRHPGEVKELELIDAPDTYDLAALRDLLRDLR